ncbi:DNA ligase [[Clostridium] innocuum]|nr:DNA ligase [[Clostridium] innocuum]MCR0444148.1 DNA ligase [[Clostridium] innocuum]
MDFAARDASPMLIGLEQPAFDDEDYIYEWKLDGVRCLLYLDKDSTELRNKRNLKLNAKFPELTQLHKQVKTRCILDGELYIFHNGEPDFFQVQKRTLTSDPFKIRLHSRQFPASFTAFDILYYKDTCVIDQPLMKRKKMLEKTVRENERLSVSRYIETNGIALFELTKQRGLEGIVAKRKDSRYVCGKRTKDWIKCKNLLDDDFIVCGYIVKEKGIVSLVLAQYDVQNHIVYKGHVTMGASLPYLMEHSEKTDTSFLPSIPGGNEEAVWIDPPLVGTVKFMQYTEQGGLRKPVFKGFREDKTIRECRSKH